MPPRKRVDNMPRIETGEVIHVSDLNEEAPECFLRVGQLVHLVSSGRTLQYREVLGMDDKFLKIRSDVTVSPQTEVVLIPWARIEAIGITDER